MADEHYKILGLKKGCSVYQAKKAFHKLAKQYHPDTNPGDPVTSLKFKELNDAYHAVREDFYHYYEVLGLDKSATKEDIVKAYYDLTHNYVGKGRNNKADENLVKRYREIEDAYAVLCLGEDDVTDEEDGW